MKTTSLCSLVLSVGTILLHQAPAVRAQAIVYDPTADYSITNGNPNGVWSYGWMPVGFGTLSLLTNSFLSGAGNLHWGGWNYDYTPGIWKNLGSLAYGVPPGWLSLHPGPGQEPSVLRWTAPAAGTVDVEGQFLPGDGAALQVAVRLNGQPWWSATDAGSFSLHTNVVADATIDFTVYGGYSYGNTPVSVLISTTPAPRLHLARDGLTNTVSFTAPTDGTYVLQFTDNLTPPIRWTDVSTNVLSANQVFSLTEAPTNLAGFYRARLD